MTALNLTWSPDLEGSTFNDYWHFTDRERENQEQILEKNLYFILQYVIKMHEISECLKCYFRNQVIWKCFKLSGSFLYVSLLIAPSSHFPHVSTNTVLVLRLTVA